MTRDLAPGRTAGRRVDGVFSRAMRDGLRRLRRHPGFSLFAVATLGLGVGLNTAIFSVAYQVLIAPLPIPGSEGIMMLAQRNPRLGTGLNSVSPASYLALQQSLRAVDPCGCSASRAHYDDEEGGRLSSRAAAR